MELNVFGATHIGQRRTNNEDRFLIDKDINLFIVCDGMGGHAAGEVASQMAVTEVQKYLQDQEEEITALCETPGEMHKLVAIARLAVEKACATIFHVGEREPVYQGMGTTLSMLWFIGNKAILAHVGDSRIYLLRNNKVSLLSNDHTVQNESKVKLSSAYANILTRCLGTRELVVVDTLLLDILPDDIYFLCSDGLNSLEEMKAFVDTNNMTTSVNNLTHMANNRGGNDNITAILVKVQKTQDKKLTERAEKMLRFLQQLPWLKGVPYRQIIRLKNVCEITHVTAGEVFIRESDLGNKMYLILSGEVSLIQQNKQVKELKTSQYFAEENMITTLPVPYSAKATSETKLLTLHREDLRNLLYRFPKLGNQINGKFLEYIVNKYIKKTGVQIT